jgi:hypothetical protein
VGENNEFLGSSINAIADLEFRATIPIKVHLFPLEMGNHPHRLAWKADWMTARTR